MEINVKRKRAKSVRVSFEYIISKTTRACTPIYIYIYYTRIKHVRSRLLLLLLLLLLFDGGV